jgi:hypothetical protein
MASKQKVAKQRRRSAVPVLDVTAEAETRRNGLAAHAHALLEKCLEAAKDEGVDAVRVAEVRAQHDAFQHQLALEQAMVDHTRMMHAAQKLHGWRTLEEVMACVAAAQAGDPEAVRAICELVELVQSGGGGGDAS